MSRLEELKEQAERLKKEIASLDNIQNALKVLMNSLFGAQANSFFRFNDPDNAEAITLSGQKFIQSVGADINDYMVQLLGPGKYLIYTDTDSVYINFEKLADKFPNVSVEKMVDMLDQFAQKKVSPKIAAACEKVATNFNVYENQLSVKREKICQAGIWTGKKRYALLVHDNEGIRYTHPDVAVTGIEVKRSSTPKVVRDFLEDALRLILEKGEKETQDFVAQVEEEFLKMSPSEIAFPRGVNDLKKWRIDSPGVPIHVRAALAYNEQVKQKGVEHIYPLIASGQKIKFIHLKEPNPVRQNVIAFIDKLPPEFKLDEYVDRSEQFQKTFLAPIGTILSACNWSVVKVNTLEDFFG